MGVSHGLFLTLFHPYVAQECIPEAWWIKMPCQRARKKENLHSELSVVFLFGFAMKSRQKKSSPSAHKLAERFISPMTFSLEMPLGAWATLLESVDRAIVSTSSSQNLFSGLIFAGCFSSLLLLVLFLSPYDTCQKQWQTFKRHRPRLTSVHFNLLISNSFSFVKFKDLWDKADKSMMSGKNVLHDRWQMRDSF